MSEQRDYYVSMRKGEGLKQPHALMAGPFPTHEDALAFVDPVRREASRLDAWADFYFFGTLSIPRKPDNKVGWLNVYLGIKSAENIS